MTATSPTQFPNNGIRISGPVSATITIPGTVNRETVISGPLTGSITYGSLPAQVILNAQNATSGSFWNGSITIGGTLLSGTLLSPLPQYAQPSTPLGGGAVGVLPYRLYKTDSIPAMLEPGESFSAIPSTTLVPASFANNTTPISIRFYGPITRIEPNDEWRDAVVIECVPLSVAAAPCASGLSWHTITNGFTVFGPDSSATGINRRTLRIGRADSNNIGPGLYRVRFTGIGCADVVGMVPAVVATRHCTVQPDSAAYYFRVGPDCDNDGVDDTLVTPTTCNSTSGCSDFDTNGQIEVADIFAFLAGWFGGCQTASVPPAAPCYRSADFDGNGELNVPDIFAFLTAWFANANNC